MNKEIAKQKLKASEIQIHFDDKSKSKLLIELFELPNLYLYNDYYIQNGEKSLSASRSYQGIAIVKISDITEDSSEIQTESIDHINPEHYKKFSYEVIEMMEAIWGKESTAIHCEMCAFKYRLRMGEKPDQPIERDLGKVKWYLNKATELRK